MSDNILSSQSPHQTPSSARFSVPHLRTVRFEGPDAAKFLQGYLTCNTLQMDTDWHFTALTNIKGRAVCTGWLLSREGGLDFVLHEQLAQVAADFLAPYQRFSRTKAVIEDSFPVLSLAEEINWVRPTTDAISTHAENPSVGSAGDIAGWEDQLIEQGVVLLQGETSALFLPQALGMTRLAAVDFNKGCYLGQEVIARAQHRGALKRQLGIIKLVEADQTQPIAPAAAADVAIADPSKGASKGTLLNWNGEKGLAVVPVGCPNRGEVQGRSGGDRTARIALPGHPRCPLSSVLCPLSSVLCPLSSVLCPLSSVLCPLSSVLCPAR